jgi:hypothetical protein
MAGELVVAAWVIKSMYVRSWVWKEIVDMMLR